MSSIITGSKWRNGNPVVTTRMRPFTQSGDTIFSRIARAKPDHDLAWGNPGKDGDALGAPRPVRKLISRLAKTDRQAYSPSAGHGPLLEALDANLYLETGHIVGSQNIFVTYGATGAFEGIVRCTVDETSAVFLPERTYPPFISLVKEEGGRIYAYRSLENGQPDTEHLEYQLRRARRDGFDSKFVYENYPNNPTTIVSSVQNLREIKNLARKYGVFVIADDVYYQVVLGNTRATHLSSLLTQDDEGRIPVVQMWSLSKRFGLCGARVGGVYFINSDETPAMLELRNGISRYNGIHLCAPTLQQKAAAELVMEISPNQQQLARIRERQDAVFESFRTEGVNLGKRPKATFYMWVELDPRFGTWKSDTDFALKLAEKGVNITHKRLGVTPGSAFYCGPENENPGQYLRIALVEPPEKLRAAGEIFRAFMKENKR